MNKKRIIIPVIAIAVVLVIVGGFVYVDNNETAEELKLDHKELKDKYHYLLDEELCTGNITIDEFRVKNAKIIEKEKMIFGKVKELDWSDSGDVTTYNYFYRSVMKFPSPWHVYELEDKDFLCSRLP